MVAESLVPYEVSRGCTEDVEYTTTIFATERDMRWLITNLQQEHKSASIPNSILLSTMLSTSIEEVMCTEGFIDVNNTKVLIKDAVFLSPLYLTRVTLMVLL